MHNVSQIGRELQSVAFCSGYFVEIAENRAGLAFVKLPSNSWSHRFDFVVNNFFSFEGEINGQASTWIWRF